MGTECLISSRSALFAHTKIVSMTRTYHKVNHKLGAQWLSGRVLDSRPKGCGFEPHRRHCVVSLSKNINPSLVLVQPRKTRPFITERLLMGRKESNQTKQNNYKLQTNPWHQEEEPQNNHKTPGKQTKQSNQLSISL